MKRLCIFYFLAYKWQKRNVRWIVCKECQKKIRQGRLIGLLFKAAAEAKMVEYIG